MDVVNQRTDDAGAREGFDPLAYIESAFTDTKREKPKAPATDELDVDLPTIGQFLGTRNGGEATTEALPAVEKDIRKDLPQTDRAESSKVRFRKRQLSAPRPRKVRKAPKESSIEPELEEIWASLPRNIQFLSSFFDDKVTANYYRGEFRESRQELIRRLLDPELSLEEVSRLLGVCPATVRRYTNREWLKHHRTPGGQRRFRLSGVVKFVEEHGRHPEG